MESLDGYENTLEKILRFQRVWRDDGQSSFDFLNKFRRLCVPCPPVSIATRKNKCVPWSSRLDCYGEEQVCSMVLPSRLLRGRTSVFLSTCRISLFSLRLLCLLQRLLEEKCLVDVTVRKYPALWRPSLVAYPVTMGLVLRHLILFIFFIYIFVYLAPASTKPAG